MARFGGDIESVKRLAERKFLGRLHVVGIGITDEEGYGLVFLLENASKQSQAEISNWASRIGIPVEIQVVGRIRPLTAPKGMEAR